LLHGAVAAFAGLLLGSKEWRCAADRPTSDQRTVGVFSAAAGTTPLMLAARAGSSDVVRMIITAVADTLVVDRQDEDGWFVAPMKHTYYLTVLFVARVRRHSSLRPTDFGRI